MAGTGGLFVDRRAGFDQALIYIDRRFDITNQKSQWGLALIALVVGGLRRAESTDQVRADLLPQKWAYTHAA
jgi:hypothetical protein